MSSSPKPHCRACATSARARSSCTALRAATTVPPFAKWQSMPSRRCHGADLVDGALHGAVLGDGALAAVALRQPGHGCREQRRAPAPVASAGPEAGDLRLQHGDPQRRVGRRQVVRGPQPGVAGAHDRHVDVEVAGERWSRRAGRRRRCRARARAGGSRSRRAQRVHDATYDGTGGAPRRSGAGCGAPATSCSGTTPAQYRQLQVLLRVLGRAVAHLHRPLRERQREDQRRRELLAVGLPGVGPPAGQQVLGDPLQRRPAWRRPRARSRSRAPSRTGSASTTRTPTGPATSPSSSVTVRQVGAPPARLRNSRLPVEPWNSTASPSRA